MVIWFYAFFHTNHLSSLSDEEFDQIEDEYLFGLDVMDKGKDVVKQYNSWIAYALIVVGCFVLWNTGIKLSWIILPSFIYEKIWRLNSYLPSIIVSLVVIFLGIRMLKGKNNFIEGEKEDEWNKD